MIDSSEDELRSVEESKSLQFLWTTLAVIDVNASGNCLVAASKTKTVILFSKVKNDKRVFVKTWEGSISDDGADEITACLAIPLRSRHQSSESMPDWTCVVYGFRSGFVAFHTEDGWVVHRQQFDLKPVTSIKFSCRMSDLGSDGLQEILIEYESTIVVISGLELYTILQTNKGQVARAASIGSNGESIESVSIPHVKYQLSRKQNISGVASLGTASINGFDQLLNASTLGGFHATVKTPLPSFRRCITSGLNPLTANYFILDEEPPILGEVAKAVASKVKSVVASHVTAAYNFLGWKKTLSGAAVNEVDKRPKIKSAKNVEARFSIFDTNRIADAIVLSPSNRLAAITDNFGRVLLMDTESGLIVRMWKGYRNAEIGWVSVADAKEPAKMAECLVIHAPRRRLLEIWFAQVSKRLVATKVPKNCSLLRVEGSILGSDSAAHGRLHSCFLLNPRGQLYIFEVPSYLLELEEDQKDAKDLQKLQQLKEALMSGSRQLPSGSRQLPSVSGLISEIESFDVKDEAMHAVLRSTNAYLTAPMVLDILQTQIDLLSAKSPEELRDRGCLLLLSLEQKYKLLNWFLVIQRWSHAAAVIPPDLFSEFWSIFSLKVMINFAIFP